MNERKLTRNDFTKNDIVIAIGYCAAQELLKGKERIGYNAGIYGWNWNCYCVFVPKFERFVYITTGYRNLIGIRPNYDLVQSYENKASALYEKYRLLSEYDQIDIERDNLLVEMITKILEG